MYKPWGLIGWVLDRCPNVQWDLFGCLGTEERSLGTWRHLSAVNKLGQTRLLRIVDSPSPRFSARTAQLENDRFAQFIGGGGRPDDVEQHQLTEPHFQIVDTIENFVNRSRGNIILDISSLPKRFFFPVLRRLLKRSAEVRSLIVTYTVPASYTGEKLGYNPDDWDHLPLFTGTYTRAKPDMFVINVGFDALGLQDRVEHGESGLPIKLIVPFPAPAAAFRRSWELVRKLQRHRPAAIFQTYRADAREVGDAFERLVSLTGGGTRRAILAPFGPKPISVAFCIFATITESEVFYTQPTVYHPEYSNGIAMHGNLPAINGYILRLNGHDYYSIP